MTESHQFSPDELAAIDRMKRIPWASRFYSTVDNPTVPGGKVDMFLLVDDDSGEGIVSLGVPHGQGFIANWIAGCCSDPWFVKTPELADMTEMAVAMNAGIEQFAKDGSVDGYGVAMAALTIFEAYMMALPKRARNELANRLLGQVNRFRAP